MLVTVELIEVNLDSRERLAEIVKTARGKMSQRAYGKVIGVSGTTIQGWENKQYVPETENLARIAATAGMTLEELLDYLNGKPKSDLIDQMLQQIPMLPLQKVVEIGAAVNARFAKVAEEARAIVS